MSWHKTQEVKNPNKMLSRGSTRLDTTPCGVVCFARDDLQMSPPYDQKCITRTFGPSEPSVSFITTSCYLFLLPMEAMISEKFVLGMILIVPGMI